MAIAKASSFGKRGATVAARAPARPAANGGTSALAATESGIPLDVIAKQLIGEGAARANTPEARSVEGYVPWSWRASMLAGIAASSLQAGLIVWQSQNAGSALPGLPGVNVAPGVGSPVTAALIAYGLWSGAREAAGSMMFSHFGLRLFGLRTPIAYAVGGGAGGAAMAYISEALAGGEANLITSVATGLVTGFLYRMFAGLRAK